MFLIDAEVWRAMSPKRVPGVMSITALPIALNAPCCWHRSPWRLKEGGGQRQLEHTWNSQYCMRLWRVCR
jgi:hypothetical protein